MSDFDVDFDAEPAPAKRIATPPPPPPVEAIGQGADLVPVRRRERVNPSDLTRTPPHSAEAEQHVIACCLLDNGDTLARCQGEHIAPDAFYSPANRLLYEVMLEVHSSGKPVEISVLAQELTNRQQIDAVGGFPYLMQISSGVTTTAHAGYFIDTIRQKHTLRELIKAATAAIEQAYSGSDVDKLVQETEDSIKGLAFQGARLALRPITEFEVPPDDDPTVLLGLRYLNRGDGMVISSTSGVGKSSISLQLAIHWALGRSCFGIPANGKLRSLIVQSEDSDGDIAEIWVSMKYKMGLSDDEMAQVKDRVKIVTDRVFRGERFLHSLRKNITQHQPDLVWINPLQAFIDGDVTDSQDLGAFLREGLNGLNQESKFGIVLVHHTTKPQTGKDKGERQWHEVMYDMAGGAEIINWARAIMSLRAAKQEGNFTLVLAKRGKRAGVTKRVEDGLNTHYEVVTKIPLKHCTESIKIPSRTRPMSVIYWEDRELLAGEDGAPKEKPGRKAEKTIEDMRVFIPGPGQTAIPMPRIIALASENLGISRTTARSLVFDAQADGLIEMVTITGGRQGFRFKL